MEEPLDNLENKPALKKIYSGQAAFWGTLIGGPIALSYMISQNYRAFNQPTTATNAWIFTMIAYILVIFLSKEIPFLEEYSTAVFLGLAFGGQAAVNIIQQNEIKNHLSQGGKTQPIWMVLWVIFLCLIITTIITLGIAEVMAPGTISDLLEIVRENNN